MTNNYTFSNKIPGKWRLLGEIELLRDAAINDHIYAWLIETLRPLDLNTRFLNKILASTELVSVVNSTGAVKAANGHMHLLIFMPEDGPTSGQSWGFFRVEKKGDPQSAEPNQDHAIVYYLYREGV